MEDRRLLSVNIAYVDDAADFTDTSAPGNQGNPQAGDIVTWNGGGQFTTPVAGLTFGTDAFTSIAAAVANTSAGGTVDVAPGTYNEHEIDLTQAITLNGPNFGVNPNPPGSRSSEAIIDAQTLGGGLVISGDDVTVDGFTVEGAQGGSGAGIVMGGATSGVHVLNNIVTGNQIGISAESNGPSTIQDNLITGNNLPGASGGAGIYTEHSNGLTIDSNVFTDNNINSSMIFAATAADVHQNLTVTNNTVVESAANTNSSIYAVSVNGAVFSGNDVSGGTAAALKFAGDDSDISVVNNSFHDADTGVAVIDAGFGFGPSSNITINYNSFTGNATQALEVDAGPGVYTGTLDASKNWWGDISGPTIASNFGGLGQTITAPGSNVTYAPWLIYGTDADAVAPGFQLPATVNVTSQGDTSPAVNDFTILQNAIGAAATGQTIDLSGNFDWTQTNSAAAAAYAASTNTAPTADVRGVALPDGVNNLTITSSAQNATITGVGDSTDGIYNTFVFSAVNASSPSHVGNNQLTISKLNINNFKSGVMLGWNSTGTFDGTLVKDNTITVAADNDNNVNDAQGIAVYFTRGQNQTMTGNTIDFEGNGTRTTGAGARSYGFQNSTTGGTGYNGLSIDNNIFELLPSAVGGAEVVTGVWENGHNDNNASVITIAHNQFLGIQGQRQFDIGLQLSSQTNQMSIDGNTFTDVKYVYWVGTHNGDAPGDQFTFTNNVLTRVGDATGVFLQNRIDALPGDVITINWNTNNTIDGKTGIRGLNELSTQATEESRPASGASDLDAVVAFGPIQVDYVNDNWGAQGRFTNPLAAPDGTPGPIAFGFNTFNTIQGGVDGINTTPGTVNVLPGTYAENVTIDKNLTLAGDATNPTAAVISPVAGNGITITAPATDVTVQNFEITGAANGIDASGLTTLNLSDLTLTGNAAGGTISGVTTVNDTPITGSTGATDTITGSSFQRNGDDMVNYLGVTNLNVTGSAGSDTFDVTPAPSTTTITVNGGLPTPPATPGDALNVVLAGTTTPSLSDTLTANGHQGAWTFGNAMPINYQGIETLGNNTDLSIVKTDNSSPAGSAAPGTQLTYTIVVTNAGPNAVTGATVTDNLPANFTGSSYTTVLAAGATDANPTGNGNISDTVNLPVGGTITYTVTGTISSSATGALTNTATVAAPANTLDTNVANNTSTPTAITLTPQADLQITKTDNSPSQGHAIRGATLTYTITVTNAGPSDVTGAVVTDLFPADFTGATYIASETLGATGATLAGAGNIADTVDMPAGSTITYVVTGTVNPAATGALTNTATVAAPGGVTDTDLTNNSATDANTLSQTADLQIAKTDNSATPGSAVPGTNLTYTITVTNAGPVAVTGATVTDTLPAGFTDATYTAVATGAPGATGFTASGNGNISDTVNLPVGGTITYTVTGTIASSASGSLANTATVAAPADIADPLAGNNTDTDTLTLTPQVNLSITKTDGKTTAAPGTSDTYTIVVSNTGPSDVTGAVVADTFTAAFTGAAYTAVATGGATGFTASGNGDISDTVNLPVGGTITYTVTGTIASSATGSLANTATVTAPAGATDTDLANNTATDTDTLAAQADLSITKTDSRTTVAPGVSNVYTIVVSNAGPSDVTGATVTDAFAADFTGATFTATANGGATGFTANGSGDLNETVNLPGGSSITYVVTGTVDAGATGTLTNTAAVAAPAGVTEVNSGNNSATDTDTIAAATAPAITSANSADFAEGSLNSFTITATGAPTPTLTESGALPAGVTFVDNGNGTASLSGTPAAGTHGVYSLTITAHNGVGSDATQSFTLTVTPAVSQSAAAITSPSSTIFVAGANGTFIVTATGSPTPSLTETGALPGGVTFVDNGNGTATLSGTPVAGSVGVYSLTITAHNGVGSDAVQNFTLTVQAAAPTGIGYVAGVPGDGTAETFVHNLYRELLGREPDAAGLAFWTNYLQQNNTAAGRQHVITGFMNSQEYKEHYVTAVYEFFLGRVPDAGGLQFWTTLMGQPGTPGGHNGSADEKFVLAAIVGSDEFYGDAGGTNQGWVNALYQDFLGRSADAGGLAFWTGLVNAGVDRDGLARLFLSTPEANHLLLDSFYPAQGGTASHPLPAPGTQTTGSTDLALLTGGGWENLYLQGPYDSQPEANDVFFAELAGGVAWDDVQLHILESEQFYNNPNRPTTL